MNPDTPPKIPVRMNSMIRNPSESVSGKYFITYPLKIILNTNWSSWQTLLLLVWVTLDILRITTLVKTWHSYIYTRYELIIIQMFYQINLILFEIEILLPLLMFGTLLDLGSMYFCRSNSESLLRNFNCFLLIFNQLSLLFDSKRG